MKDELDFYMIPLPISMYDMVLEAVNEVEFKKIVEWLEDKCLGVEIYSTKERFSQQDFHHSCDSKGPTLILVRMSDGSLVGGFAPLSWKSEIHHSPPNNAFAFSLTDTTSTKHDNVTQICGAIGLGFFTVGSTYWLFLSFKNLGMSRKMGPKIDYLTEKEIVVYSVE